MLPPSERVDVNVLTRLFANTTNSYKFLLMFAVLDHLEQSYGNPDDEPVRISHRELGIGMLLNAWFPHTYFRLSFGRQDRVAQLLDRLAPRDAGTKFSFDAEGRSRLKTTLLAREDLDTELRAILRYVVQRLLRGFFEADLRGRKDAEIDRALTSMVRESFEERRPLYRVDSDNHVTLHPAWVAYLRVNLTVIRGWASWEWVSYMQRKNPHVPAVPQKLFPPRERASLAEQTRFWHHSFSAQELTCIYSGLKLSPKLAALDHYLPWSFLAHDRLWNLVPVSQAANSSKSDCLPSEIYLSRLTDLQAQGLLAARPYYKSAEWCRITEGYVSDLNIPSEVLWREELEAETLTQRLKHGYARVIPTLTELAAQLGFPKEWRWRATA